MGDAVDQFLEAEQAVTAVLDELDTLRAQVGGYATAKKTLDDLRGDFAQFLEQSRSIAADTKAGVALLTTLSMPEVFTRLERIRDSIHNEQAKLASQSNALELRLRSTVETSMRGVQEECASATAKLGGSAEEGIRALESSTREILQNAAAQLAEEARASRDSQREQLAQVASALQERIDASFKRAAQEQEGRLKQFLADADALGQKNAAKFEELLSRVSPAIQRVLESDSAARGKHRDEIKNDLSASSARAEKHFKQMRAILIGQAAVSGILAAAVVVSLIL